MAKQLLELEGTWEEILARCDQLAGRRVRVTILPERDGPAEEGSPGLDQTAMLELLDEWQQAPLTAEEEKILDGFEGFRKEHPFRLRKIEEGP
jgi:hypothetical protein